MSSATAVKGAEVKSVGEAVDLPVECLVPGQNRDVKKDEDLKSLAASIAAVDLIYRIVVRPETDKSGFYRIIAGERCWRALKQLKAPTAPCLLVDSDDGRSDPELLRLVENHQRKNLSPLEEALAIRTQLDAGLEAEAVARSMGRSRAWIARRSSLAELSVAWIAELDYEDSKISVWPASHLELIARFPTEVQDAMLGFWGDFGDTLLNS